MKSTQNNIITEMKSVFKLWRVKDLTLMFKTLVLSKIIFHFDMSKVPNKVLR